MKPCGVRLCVLYPSYLSCPVNDREGQRDNLGTWEVPSVLACLYCAVVGAVSVVESPGLCRDGAGSILAACMALLPKRRQEEGNECAAAARD